MAKDASLAFWTSKALAIFVFHLAVAPLEAGLLAWRSAGGTARPVVPIDATVILLVAVAFLVLSVMLWSGAERFGPPDAIWLEGGRSGRFAREGLVGGIGLLLVLGGFPAILERILGRFLVDPTLMVTSVRMSDIVSGGIDVTIGVASLMYAFSASSPGSPMARTNEGGRPFHR